LVLGHSDPGDRMRRREVLLLFGGTAAAWPCTAHAQHATPVVGFLNSVSPGPWTDLVAAFRKGLSETGFVEGQNVAIEYRWAEGRYDSLPALADDLVRRRVGVIVATGGSPAALAAKAATATIPVVFISGGASDPVRLGLVGSMNRPGGNATGIHFVIGLEPKRLEMLRELVPSAGLIAVLLNPRSPGATTQLRAIEDAARAVSQPIQVLNASTDAEIDTAFADLVRERVGAVLVGADPFFNSRRRQLVELAAHHRVPAIYELREFVAAGGLISYGNDLREAYRQVGLYTGRILKGERPAELPVVQPTEFELVINLKTAKALGLDIPPALLARADEVIE
jgi:putative ABC transport system substrate-binding protein